MKSNICYLVLIFAIALGLNLYVAIKEIPENIYSDNIIDLELSNLCYENGWEIHQAHGQSYTSIVVGWIVPKIARLLNISVEDVYQYVLPIVFSFTPLLLYLLYRKFTDNHKAFIGAMFFLTLPPTYQEIPTRGKSEFAEPFTALVLLILFSNIKTPYKIIIGCLASYICIASHYTIGVFLILWLITMVFWTKDKNAFAAVAFTSIVFFFVYYSYISNGELIKQLLVWNYLGSHVDPITELILASNNITMDALSMPYTSIVIQDNVKQLWLIRAFIYTDIAILCAGLIYFIKHKVYKLANEYLALIGVSVITVLCALFIPFFTYGLYISVWIQLSAFSLSLLYGLSTNYISKWIPYLLIIGLLVISVVKY